MSVAFTKRGSEAPFSMPEDRDTHEAWKSKPTGYKTKRVLHNELTTDAYADSKVFDMRLFSKALVHIKELNVNAIKYQILGCLDPSMWKILKTETVITTGNDAYETLTDAWNYLKIQIASNVAGNAGKVNAFIEGKTP